MNLLTRTGLSCVLLSGLAIFAGCKSSGHSDVEATSTRMEALRSKVETLKTQVSASAGSLAGLVDKADSDPKPQFEQFEKDAKAVESSYNSAQERVTEVRAGADKLFKAWAENAKGITDADLKEKSEERAQNLHKLLDEVVKSAQEALDETKGFVATSNDLVKYLSQDLTPAGIKGVKDKSSKQSKAAKSIAEKLDEVMEVAHKAAGEFAQAKPPPPKQ